MAYEGMGILDTNDDYWNGWGTSLVFGGVWCVNISFFWEVAMGDLGLKEEVSSFFVCVILDNDSLRELMPRILGVVGLLSRGSVL